ncbi:hypothetical protein [Flavobacterium sp.]|uniref:hypothetical protein n=1 Tax=Flavobacterium sp. TaxID=239 RepID=UPI004047D54D
MKKVILTIAAAITLQTQVYCQLVNYNDKGKVKILAEKTTLSITGEKAKLKPDNQVAGIVAAAGAILPPVIDLVVTSIKEKAKKNALAYKGEYKSFVSGQNFYESNDYALLPKLTLTRKIKTTDRKDEIAVNIELVPELSADKTAFRYSIKNKCEYKYSIAKTKGKYDFIDVNIEIKFKSLSINKDEYKLNDLRTTVVTIPMVQIGNTTTLAETVYSGWIPLPPRSTAKNTEAEPVTEEKTVIKTDKNGVKEKTIEETTTKKSNVEEYDKLADNTGLYEIEITVTETNPYKIKAENKQAIIESSSESGTAILKEVVKVLTQEKEENKEDK